ncbi:MAG: NTP transferase domain-containing protein [Arcanobacterium sp.]|nr:NTP transferase domain-containing protein [Arcanobacterium sp.]
MATIGELAACITLAGGTGVRLGGVSKPDYQVGGVRLLDVAYHAMQRVGFVGQLVVVAPETVAIPSRAWRALEDPPQGGPLAGVQAGVQELAEFPGSALVALSTCDAPLSPMLWKEQTAVCTKTVQGAVPFSEVAVQLESSTERRTHLHYLLGVYWLADLRGLPYGRNRSVRSAFSALELAEVPDPESFCADVDTPADARALEARLTPFRSSAPCRQ